MTTELIVTDADRIATARALVLIGQDPVTFNVSLLAEEFARHRIAAEAAIIHERDQAEADLHKAIDSLVSDLAAKDAEIARLREAIGEYIHDRSSWFSGETSYDRLKQVLTPLPT